MFSRLISPKNESAEEEGDPPPPGESTPLLSTAPSTDNKQEQFQSFRRRSVAKLSIRAVSQKEGDLEGGAARSASYWDLLRTNRALVVQLDETLPTAQPLEGLAPLFPNGGIAAYEDRERIPYRDASLVKSIPAFAPYRRKDRHRSFYLWWTNVSSFI